jgi:hypothetical protein
LILLLNVRLLCICPVPSPLLVKTLMAKLPAICSAAPKFT